MEADLTMIRIAFDFTCVEVMMATKKTRVDRHLHEFDGADIALRRRPHHRHVHLVQIVGMSNGVLL